MLLENPGKGGTINHLGVEVESSDTVHAEIARLSGEGLFTDEEIGTTCCFATQDKVWVTGPAGEKWEIYTVLSDSDTFGASPNISTKTTPRAASAAVAPASADAEMFSPDRPAADTSSAQRAVNAPPTRTTPVHPRVRLRTASTSVNIEMCRSRAWN